MTIVAWIVLGLISGFIGGKLVGDEGDGLLRYLALGVGGALAGGWLLYTLISGGAAEFNLWGALAAVIGAGSALALHQAVRRRA